MLLAHTPEGSQKVSDKRQGESNSEWVPARGGRRLDNSQQEVETPEGKDNSQQRVEIPEAEGTSERLQRAEVVVNTDRVRRTEE
jgi:hypothetical protein